jgi:hypothetical protein
MQTSPPSPPFRAGGIRGTPVPGGTAAIRSCWFAVPVKNNLVEFSGNSPAANYFGRLAPSPF